MYCLYCFRGVGGDVFETMVPRDANMENILKVPRRPDLNSESCPVVVAKGGLGVKTYLKNPNLLCAGVLGVP